MGEQRIKKVRPPLFPNDEKKSSKIPTGGIRTHAHNWYLILHPALYQQSHQDDRVREEIFIKMNNKNVFAGF